APGVGGALRLMAVRNRARRPDSERCHRCGPRSARRTDANWTINSVCREQAGVERRTGRLRLISQPSSRTGENPPYGMIGRIEETSASFEARSASRSQQNNAAVAFGVSTWASANALPLKKIVVHGWTF